jgi:hypothetical protein
LPREIADTQLVLDQQGLGNDGADGTGPKERRESDQQVDGKDEDFTHQRSRDCTAGADFLIRIRRPQDRGRVSDSDGD